MQYFPTLKNLLFSPLKTLELLKLEEGIVEPFKFLVVSVLITNLITFMFLLIENPFLTALVAFVVRSLIGIVGTFLIAGLLHGIVMLLGGKNPYYQTFKAFAYISAYSIFWALLSGIAIFIPRQVSLAALAIYFIFALWILILLNSAFKFYTDLSTGKMIILGVIVFILFIAAVGVYIVYGPPVSS